MDFEQRIIPLRGCVVKYELKQMLLLLHETSNETLKHKVFLSKAMSFIQKM